MNDHLGAHYDAEVLYNCIRTCKEEETEFGAQHDINQSYRAMSNLGLLGGRLHNLRSSADYDQCMEAAFHDSMVKRWTKRAGVQSLHTALI